MDCILEPVQTTMIIPVFNITVFIFIYLFFVQKGFAKSPKMIIRLRLTIQSVEGLYVQRIMYIHV